jgi:hypothetical protein
MQNSEPYMHACMQSMLLTVAHASSLLSKAAALYTGGDELVEALLSLQPSLIR